MFCLYHFIPIYIIYPTALRANPATVPRSSRLLLTILGFIWYSACRNVSRKVRNTGRNARHFFVNNIELYFEKKKHGKSRTIGPQIMKIYGKHVKSLCLHYEKSQNSCPKIVKNWSWECHYGSWGGPWVPKGARDEKVSPRVVRWTSPPSGGTPKWA